MFAYSKSRYILHIVLWRYRTIGGTKMTSSTSLPKLEVYVAPSSTQVVDSGENALPLTEERMQQITQTINFAVSSLIVQLVEQPAPTPSKLQVREVELSFGVDFKLEGESSILLRPLGAFRTNAGATFEVKVTISR
jgi:hypothetical protein